VSCSILGFLLGMKGTARNALMELSKTSFDSNTFTLTLGLGRKKNSTLDNVKIVSQEKRFR